MNTSEMLDQQLRQLAVGTRYDCHIDHMSAGGNLFTYYRYRLPGTFRPRVEVTVRTVSDAEWNFTVKDLGTPSPKDVDLGVSGRRWYAAELDFPMEAIRKYVRGVLIIKEEEA